MILGGKLGEFELVGVGVFVLLGRPNTSLKCGQNEHYTKIYNKYSCFEWKSDINNISGLKNIRLYEDDINL